MFAETRRYAIAAGAQKIDATICVDNVKGLGFYRSQGFIDARIYPDLPMSDGVKVDRIQTLYDLARQGYTFAKILINTVTLCCGLASP